MKRKIESFGTSIRIQAVDVYRQQVEDVVRVIKEATHDRPVLFETAGYAYDSLDELIREQGTEPDEVTIRAEERQNSPSITLDRSAISIYFTRKDLQGMAFEIQQILQRYRRLFVIEHEGVRVLIGVCAPSAFALGIISLLNIPTTLIISGVGPWAMAILLFLLMVALGVFLPRLVPHGCRVRLVRRHEHQAFWKRHEENLIRGLIGLVSAILGGLVVYQLTH